MSKILRGEHCSSSIFWECGTFQYFSMQGISGWRSLGNNYTQSVCGQVICVLVYELSSVAPGSALRMSEKKVHCKMTVCL